MHVTCNICQRTAVFFSDYWSSHVWGSSPGAYLQVYRVTLHWGLRLKVSWQIERSLTLGGAIAPVIGANARALASNPGCLTHLNNISRRCLPTKRISQYSWIADILRSSLLCVRHLDQLELLRDDAIRPGHGRYFFRPSPNLYQTFLKGWHSLVA